MNNHNFKNKKIGIWGFGIVGKSVYDFIQSCSCSIQILDKQFQDNPYWIEQTDASIIQFLEYNDVIITSPGIPLHNYQEYHHKFITELDIFAQIYTGTTIAITGTLGKTSITHAIQHCSPESIAAGNIGYPMITAACQNPPPAKIVLELSSFQLQHIKNFAPNIALWTNFYPNHLDHHTNENEYFLSKCNIFKHQKEDNIAIIPCNLIQRIQDGITLKSQLFLTCNQDCAIHSYPTFHIQNNTVVLSQNDKKQITIFDNVEALSMYTYAENWVQIIAALYVQKIDLQNLITHTKTIPAQQDRLEKITIYKGTTFYNDSKSTVWQATQQAIMTLKGQSCALFLGGISKGTDRSPLIAYLKDKPITVFAFGKEAKLLQNLCQQYNVTCFACQNLEEALQVCMSNPLPQNVLFSPAGASFDLFKNYHHRGDIFKQLVCKFTAK